MELGADLLELVPGQVRLRVVEMAADGTVDDANVEASRKAERELHAKRGRWEMRRRREEEMRLRKGPNMDINDDTAWMGTGKGILKATHKEVSSRKKSAAEPLFTHKLLDESVGAAKKMFGSLFG